MSGGRSIFAHAQLSPCLGQQPLCVIIYRDSELGILSKQPLDLSVQTSTRLHRRYPVENDPDARRAGLQEVVNVWRDHLGGGGVLQRSGCETLLDVENSRHKPCIKPVLLPGARGRIRGLGFRLLLPSCSSTSTRLLVLFLLALSKQQLAKMAHLRKGLFQFRGEWDECNQTTTLAISRESCHPQTLHLPCSFPSFPPSLPPSLPLSLGRIPETRTTRQKG